MQRLCVFFMICVLSVPLLFAVCQADDWTPPPPTGDDGFDWIELKSGEWLKGRIKSMQQEDLEFDSEELDVRVWDWEDIRTVRSSRLLSMRFGQDKVVDGSLLVTKTEAQVVNDSGIQSFPRAELVAITPTGSRPRDKWSLDLSIGSDISQGNSDEVSNNSQITLLRRTPLSRQKLEYLSNYGKVDGVVNKDDQRLLLNSDFFLSRRFFIRLPDLEYFRDAQQNLDRRVTLGSSVGYDLIQTPRTNWQVTAGPAFQTSSYHSVEAAESKTESSAALILGTHFDTELTKRLDFTFDYRGQFPGGNVGSNMHHTVFSFEYEIHKRLTLDLRLIWDRIAKPQARQDGRTPEPDDFQFVTGLGIHF